MSCQAKTATVSPKGRITVLAGVLIVLMTAGTAFAKDSKGRHKLSPELTQFNTAVGQGKLNKTQTIRVIVQFTERPEQKHFAKMAGWGGRNLRKFHSLKGGVFTIPLSALAALESDSDIAYVSPDRTLKNSSLDTFQETIGANLAHSNGWDGNGIGVAVIDSGVSDHPDLHDPVTGLSRVVYSESFVPGLDASDGYGHGTHVAGIIGGNGALSSGWISGVAPRVNVINFRVLDSTGAGSDSYVIAAIERAIALKDTYNIRVINLSLGRPVYDTFTVDPLCQAVEAAWKAGIVVVAAAGNMGRNNDFGTHGYGLIGVPGVDPYVITVGAMNTVGTADKSDDVLATYSSKGPTMVDHIVKPDLVAPGNRIESLLAPNNFLAQELPGNVVSPLEYGSLSSQPGYLALSGTSMATPVVAGAAALLLQQDPTLSPDAVKARLMKTADKAFPLQSVIVDSVTGE